MEGIENGNLRQNISSRKGCKRRWRFSSRRGHKGGRVLFISMQWSAVSIQEVIKTFGYPIRNLKSLHPTNKYKFIPNNLTT